MHKIIMTTLLAVTLLLFSFLALAQTKDIYFQQIDNDIKRLDTQITIIGTQLNHINDTTTKIFVKVHEESFWDDMKTNLLASYVYDVLGFNGATTGSIVAKIISALYVFYLILRIRQWKAQKRKGEKLSLLDYFGIFVTSIQAAFSIFVLLASVFFTNDTVLDKSGFADANKKIEELNRNIATLKEVDFNVLSDKLNRLEELKIDTLSAVDKAEFIRIEQAVNTSYKNSSATLNNLVRRTDSLKLLLAKNLERSDHATNGWQNMQTILLFILMIGLGYVIFYMRSLR